MAPEQSRIEPGAATIAGATLAPGAGATVSATPATPAGTTPDRDQTPFDPRRTLRGRLRWLGPYLVASLLLVLGYLHYGRGAEYSLSERFYRNWAFPEFRYSDLIWLYLRDNLSQQPIPYLDYPLEYPPLTGLVTYLLSYLPTLPVYFAVSYSLLALSALGTIWALRQLPGANPWLFAAAPALFFYTGHQWDGIAIFVTAVSLVAVVRGRENWGTLGLAAGVSLKLFPVVFIAALFIDRLRRRQFRAALEIAAIAGGVILAVNVPVALANVQNWSWFIRWNRDRLADAGIWVIWRDLPTAEITTISMITVILGGLAITALALRAKGPLMLPLGATYLLWWMLANKTFTTHLVLWVFFAAAILGVSWWLWGAIVATDLIGFQVGNFINLYNVEAFQHTQLIQMAVLYIYDPLQIIRSAIFLVAVGWGVRAVRRGEPLPVSAAATPAGAVQGTGEPIASEPATVPIASSVNEASQNPAATSRSRPRITWRAVAVWVAVLTGFTAATVAMTWPYARHLSEATLVGFDPLLQIWLSQWIQHALATNPLGLYQANIFHPFALTLAYTDANIPGALLAWPLDLVTRDPVLTNSLLVLGSFVLAAAGVYVLVTEITRNRVAGFIAGLAYAFIPYRMVHLWHLNWLQSAWLPWIAWLTLRLIQRPSRRGAVLLGVLIAVQTLTSFYFAVQIAILVGILLLAAVIAQPHLRTRRFAGHVAITAVVAAVLIVPVYLPYLDVRAEQGLERSLSDSEHYKATAVSYVQIAPWAEPNPIWGWLGQRPGPNEALTQVGQNVHADGHQHAEIVIEDALFPGMLALIGAGIAIVGWRERRWLVAALSAVAVVAAVLSLGPSWGPIDGTGFPLPYRVLYDYVPFFRAMRVPARLGGLANLAIVILFGVGIATLWRLALPRLRGVTWRRPLTVAASALLACLVLVELYAAPIPLETIDRSPEMAAPYEWLATQPEGVVMEFPAESIFADPAASSVRRHVGLTMFWSTKHWMPLVNGNSGFIPEPYSDMIEAFVGELPRADGTRTGRISHVSPDTVGLLHELDVRYLIFHRSQYHDADWPAVEAMLAEAEGSIAKIGDFGEATIYEMQPTVRPSPAPRLTLWSPTLLADDMPWAPLVTVENRADVPVLLSLTEPATLHITWYDAQGRELWRGEEVLPLPTVLTSEETLCSLEECETATGDTFPDDLPAPAESLWRPEEQGHYYVRIVLDGNQELNCLVDLDVTSDVENALEISPKSPYRWGECIPGEPNPVNAPGEVPFRSGIPSITFIGGTAAVQVPLITRDNEEVRGWFLLAPPDSPQPWTTPVYQSQIQQRLVRGDELVEFDWLEEIGNQVPTGVYGLTVWFHQRDGDEWTHAYGGTYQLAPVVVENGVARWAGPVRISLPPQRLEFAAGKTTRLRLDVGGTSSKVECDAEWRLVAPAEKRVVADGHLASCTRPSIPIPPDVTPGRYRLEIDASAIRDDRTTLSDGLTHEVIVTETSRPGQPR